MQSPTAGIGGDGDSDGDGDGDYRLEDRLLLINDRNERGMVQGLLTRLMMEQEATR